MGTEAYRETERTTGMGCRTNRANRPTTNRPFRRLGAKDLTVRVAVGFLPRLKLHSFIFAHYSIFAHYTVVLYFYFYFYHWTCATYLTFTNEHAARVIFTINRRHACHASLV